MQGAGGMTESNARTADAAQLDQPLCRPRLMSSHSPEAEQCVALGPCVLAGSATYADMKDSHDAAMAELRCVMRRDLGVE